MDDRQRVGTTGEKVAEAFLHRRGARVLGRNIENEHGEIDLVAKIGGQLVALEVRTRIGTDPIDAFDWSKIDRVRRTAAHLQPPCSRIDLITIELTDSGANIRWLPDV